MAVIAASVPVATKASTAVDPIHLNGTGGENGRAAAPMAQILSIWWSTNGKQGDWGVHFPLVECSYNNAVADAIKGVNMETSTSMNGTANAVATPLMGITTVPAVIDAVNAVNGARASAMTENIKVTAGNAPTSAVVRDTAHVHPRGDRCSRCNIRHHRHDDNHHGI